MQRCAEMIRRSQAGFTLNVGLKDRNLGKPVWHAYIIGSRSAHLCAARAHNASDFEKVPTESRRFISVIAIFINCLWRSLLVAVTTQIPRVYVSTVSQTSFVTSFNSLSRTPAIAHGTFITWSTAGDFSLFLFLPHNDGVFLIYFLCTCNIYVFYLSIYIDIFVSSVLKKKKVECTYIYLFDE